MMRLWSLVLCQVAACGVSAVAADKVPAPCNSLDDYRQQDYALGEWEIFENGHKSADAQLVKDLSGCAIRLTWTPAGPSEPRGLGLFTYSQALGRWTYLWVTDGGQTSYSTGELRHPDDMQYVTEHPLRGGGRRIRKWGLSLQADGTLRELSMGSDNGHDWSVEFDLVWRRHLRTPR